MRQPDEASRCPACGSTGSGDRFRRRSLTGLDAETTRPSTLSFGSSAGTVLSCEACGHAWVGSRHDVAASYRDTADEVTLREETGQSETARRDLAKIERFVDCGTLLDVGCWTGSFLIAALERGWQPHGVEPSAWASERARARGLDVVNGTLEAFHAWPGTYRCVAFRDVIEHLADPASALRRTREMLNGSGALYITTPDAGSRLARVLGSRWWSVMPMHVQYFTRASITELLERCGFRVALITTHAKAFSVRYYAERLGGYSKIAERAALRSAEVFGLADRIVAPDFHDRMSIVAMPLADF